MTVGDLRRVMDGLPDDTVIVAEGHFGELLDHCFLAKVVDDGRMDFRAVKPEPGPFLVINGPDLGEPPD